MDDRRAGDAFRQVRRHLRLRQADVAVRARVSQRTVSEIELGRFEHVGLDHVRDVARVLDIRIQLDVWWRSGQLDRLLDHEHARLVELTARALRAAGWDVRVEYTFNEFGERGSADILAWHATRCALAIIEVKTRIDDVQNVLSAFGRKVRLLPRIAARDLGWEPTTVGRVLVLRDTAANRDVVATHGTTFDSVWPARTAAIAAWMRDPVSDIAGIRFVPPARRRRAA